MSGRRPAPWGLYCPAGEIYGPFPNEKEVRYYQMVIHMAGMSKCKHGFLAPRHLSQQMHKEVAD